jgi:hypothetical protein
MASHSENTTCKVCLLGVLLKRINCLADLVHNRSIHSLCHTLCGHGSCCWTSHHIERVPCACVAVSVVRCVRGCAACSRCLRDCGCGCCRGCGCSRAKHCLVESSVKDYIIEDKVPTAVYRPGNAAFIHWMCNAGIRNRHAWGVCKTMIFAFF